MTPYNQLNTQNHQLTELSNVLLYLLENRSMCDTGIACDLFFDYVAKTKEHLGAVDIMYTKLLANKNQSVNNVATRFMSGEQEIKKIMAQYCKRWCSKKKRELMIDNHEEFYKDTQEVFGLMLSRIQDETEKLYPLVRTLDETKHAA